MQHTPSPPRKPPDSQKFFGPFFQKRTAALAIDAACAATAAAPLLLTAHLPLYDLPNHIAMLHVLLDRASSPTLQRIYGVHWAFVPNMALQVFAWVLHPLASIDVSVRLFCIAAVLLLCAGTRTLSRALGGTLPLYRAAPLLCWGAPMQFGFIGYCLGTGLMLLAVAFYIRQRHRPWPILVALFAPIAAVLLAAHLMAWGLFILCLAGCELAAFAGRAGSLGDRVRWLAGRAVVVAGLSLPCLLLIAAPLANTAAPGFTQTAKLSSPLFKAQSIAAITWFAMPAIELPLLLAAVACLGAGLFWGMVRPHRLMVGMFALLTLGWLVLPRNVAASAYVDYRAPWAIAFIVLSGLGTGPGATGPRVRILAGVMAGLVVVRIGSVCARAWQCEPEMAAIDHALAGLPEGASLWVVKGRIAGSLMKTPPLEHTAAYVVSRRDGFEAQAFAGAAGQMVYLKAPYRQMYRMESASVLTAPPPGFDAVLVLNPQLVRLPAGLELKCLAWGAHFLLLGQGDGVCGVPRASDIPPAIGYARARGRPTASRPGKA